MTISFAAIGIRVNSRKLLDTAIELAESRRFYQALADNTAQSHNGKAVRASLYEALKDSTDEELLDLVKRLLTLIEVGKRSSERYERIQASLAKIEPAPECEF